MSRRNRLIIILLLALTALVIVFALFFMGDGGETAHVSLPSPGQGDEVGSTAPPDYVEAVVDETNVQAVLAGLSRAEGYTGAVTITDYWDGGSAENTLQLWASDGRLLIRGAVGGSTRNVLISDGMLYIWYDTIGQVFSAPFDGSSDRWLRSLTWEDVLHLPGGSITDAGYTQYSGVECIFAEYEDGESVNRVYVSVSTGLLMGAESRVDGRLIYKMQFSLTDLSAPDDELFTPPED